MNIYNILKELNIEFEQMEHTAVYTVEEAKKLKLTLTGIGCKNLFLTDNKGRYYLLILEQDKRADIKKVAEELKTSHLSFANENKLKELLNLKRGSCSPFGIVNDFDNKVILIIDNELKNKKLLFHLNTNTTTISIHFKDLIKFIEYVEHKYILI